MKMKAMKKAKLLICVMLLVSALPASAQRWCAQQLTLFEGIAAIGEGYENPSANLPPAAAMIVIGRMDEKHQFSGIKLTPDGGEEDIAFQVTPGPPALWGTMGRVPPKFLGSPLPHEPFVGLVHILRPWPDDGTSLTEKPTRLDYNIFSTECHKGHVPDPTPEYIAQVRLCVTTGQCK